MNAVNAAGDMSSVTTTSGMSYKIPGRVGDSPIIGAGQYCDNTVGAAGSTGRGEANIKVCGAFLAVELMRQGKTPEQALLTVIERVVAMTEKRLLGANGRPLFDLDVLRGQQGRRRRRRVRIRRNTLRGVRQGRRSYPSMRVSVQADGTAAIKRGSAKSKSRGSACTSPSSSAAL